MIRRLEAQLLGALLSLVIGTIGLVVFAIKEHKTNKLSKQKTIADLKARYSSAIFLRNRSEAAQYLLDANRESSSNEALDQLLGFFNHLGLLVRRRVVSAADIWQTFGVEILCYLAALEKSTPGWQSDLPASFQNLLPLANKLRKLERKQANDDTPHLHRTTTDIQAFLQHEIKIGQS